ncbi:MAG: efflux RND transporter permease subunit [Alphaproteobacteria bacterium]|nr:efflux RND transporter permease subunit [Alphaproteobacteria bacterium]
MNISTFCINRPVATILMSLAVLLGGLFAWKLLPVAALPKAEFPTISVSADLPGASPDIMATSVATPLIKQFSTIAGVDTISSSSSLGTTNITIQFVLNRSIDAAAADVQAAISRVLRALPQNMTQPPSYRKVNPADAPVMLMAIKSKIVSMTDLDNIAENIISPTLSTLDGVAQVLIFGPQQYAVRIEMDPDALAAKGITVGQLQQAIASVNSISPLGTLVGGPQQLTLIANTQLANAGEFANQVIAIRNGSEVRLKDVARVVDSVANFQSAATHDGTRAIILAVQRQPDANTVEVVDKVKALLPDLAKNLPAAASLELMSDRSSSIRDSVSDALKTLGITILLVIAICYVFIRSLRATIIPAIAVPISLIGTLGIMYLLNFSIDNVSLMGITLAVGLVVDDAIVMMENIVRHMEEEHKGPMDAALHGASEVGFTILSISVSLVAVFIPVLLMGGVIGRIFNEFAVVVTVAILVSMFVSLTLTPMMSSRVLTEDHTPGILGRIFEVLLNGLTSAYESLLSLCLKFHPLVFLVFLGSVAATIFMFEALPKGFFPTEDIGQLQIGTQGRQDISFNAMKELQDQLAARVSKNDAVAHVVSAVGSNTGAMNSGRMFVELKPKAERAKLETVLADLRKVLNSVPGITATANPTQNLSIGARPGAALYQITVQSLNYDDMYGWAQKLADAMAKEPTFFTDVNTDAQITAQQAHLIIDREKMQALGVNVDTLRQTLYAGLGGQQVATIYNNGSSYQVIAELDPKQDWTPERLANLNVASASGSLVPLASFSHIERKAGALTVNQIGQLPSVSISYNLPQGVALGSTVDEINKLKAGLNWPVSVSTGFYGTTKTFQDSTAGQGLLILGAILTIYIILGILYESFIHPLTILSGLPAAAAGALGALSIFGFDLSIIAVIGLLMLIGIVKKNAIMMIDVAIGLRRGGMSARDAIHKACLMRFRPIMMTTLAALMGSLPIALAAGASSELRQPLGVAVVGGLVVSQALTLFITPVLYVYMEGLSNWLTGKSRSAAGQSAVAALHQPAE